MNAAGPAGLPLAGNAAHSHAAVHLPAPALSPLLQAGLAGLIFLACLVPPAINGLPLVFPDTEGYLVTAQSFRPQHIRAFGYGAFLRLTGGLWSLWLPVLAQAALAAWLATRAIALEAPRWPRAWRLPAALALVAVLLLGHLPWLAAWVQPDLFTGLLLLALWLLAEHWPALSRLERGLLLLTALGAATTHLTHPPLLAGIGLFALGVAVLRRWWFRAAGLAPVRRMLLLGFALAALSWGALAGANWITYRAPSSSLGGSVFLFARLAADTDAAAALRPGCKAGETWAICGHLDQLGLSMDDFLWRDWSPLPALGHSSGFMREAAELNPILLRHGWRDWLAHSVARTPRQLGTVELGNGMDAEGPWMLAKDMGRYGMADLAGAVSATRQAEDGMRPLMPRLTAEVLAVVGLVALAGFAALGLHRRRPALWWPALFLLACWFGNAALVALGSDVHARYSARLIWLAPLLAGILALRAATPEPRDQAAA